MDASYCQPRAGLWVVPVRPCFHAVPRRSARWPATAQPAPPRRPAGFNCLSGSPVARCGRHRTARGAAGCARPGAPEMPEAHADAEIARAQAVSAEEKVFTARGRNGRTRDGHRPDQRSRWISLGQASGPLALLPPDALVAKSLSLSRSVVFDCVADNAQRALRAQRGWAALAYVTRSRPPSNATRWPPPRRPTRGSNRARPAAR